MLDVSSRLLSRLVCPECFGPLERASDGLLCPRCTRTYPVRDGIPLLIATAHNSTAPRRPEHVRALSEDASPVDRWPKRVARRLLDAYLAFQRILIPVTPLSPLYALRAFSGALGELPTPKSVLDAGGGAAPYFREVTRAGDDYTAIDVDARSLRQAPAQDKVVGDLHAMPFSDAEFDLVIMSEVLEHLYDPSQALAHAARVLKPGGLLFLSTPQYWHIHGWPSDYYRFTIFGLQYLCERHGLIIERSEAKGGPVLLLYAVLKLNFLTFLSLPLVRVLLDVPLVLAFWGLDRLRGGFDVRSAHPDTAGWCLLARKPA